MKYLATNIDYDIDGEDINLPKSIEVDVPDTVNNDDDLVDFVSNEISNETGFCQFGFNLTKL
jgi:hypothetical protein